MRETTHEGNAVPERTRDKVVSVEARKNILADSLPPV